MNNTFNFTRLARLIQRQWIGFGKIYLMSLGIIAGIFMAFYGFFIRAAMTSQNPDDIASIFSFRPLVFIFLGLSFISIVSSSYFSNLGQKPKAIFDILIPASQLEKFLSALFYTIVLTTISYFLLFFLIDLGFVTYVRSQFTSTHTYFSMKEGKDVAVDNLLYFFHTEIPKQIYWMLFLPFLLSAVFLLGSIAFANFQFIKTAITVIIYSTVFILSMLQLMIWYTRNTVLANDNLTFSEEINVLKLMCAVGILLTLILWGIAYLKLKEKEV